MTALFKKQAAKFLGHCKSIAVYIIMITKYKYIYYVMSINIVRKYF